MIKSLVKKSLKIRYRKDCYEEILSGLSFFYPVGKGLQLLLVYGKNVIVNVLILIVITEFNFLLIGGKNGTLHVENSHFGAAVGTIDFLYFSKIYEW